MTSGLSPTLSSAFAITPEYSRSVMSTLQSLCWRMKAIVSASSRMLRALSTAPAMGTPKCASSSSGILGAITQTVSPTPMPRSFKAAASRMHRSKVSRQLRRMAP